MWFQNNQIHSNKSKKKVMQDLSPEKFKTLLRETEEGIYVEESTELVDWKTHCFKDVCSRQSWGIWYTLKKLGKFVWLCIYAHMELDKL